MEITILGCRGSTPVSGAKFDRYGGETSAVAVTRADDVPRLVLDAGTGLRNLDRLLGDAAFRGSILLSHLHWDHTHGLPFTPSIDREDAEVDVYVPDSGVDPLEVLTRAIGPPHFPITPDQLRGTWRFHALRPGRLEIAGFEVLAQDVCHKGGRTFGYRVSDGRSDLAYIPDFWQVEATTEPAELVTGVELLLHDSQHQAAEMAAKEHLGHASAEYAVGLTARHAAAHTILFHHDPSRTDEELDAIVDRLRQTDAAVSAAAAGARYSTEHESFPDPSSGKTALNHYP